MNYWLLKTEPETFSYDNLVQKGREHWDGVRNFMARNHLKSMKTGDLALFYHTGSQKGVAGICRVVKQAYPDFTAWDPNSPYFDPKSSPDKPIWYMVDVEPVQRLPRLVSLAQIKTDPELSDMVLVKAPRLSVQPVTREQFELISHLAIDKL